MSSNGKILIYVSNNSNSFSGLRNVENAVSKIANRLKLDLEIIRRSDLNSIWVYFESHDGQLIPVYFNYWSKCREEEVYTRIRNMMFVLSFHPKFSDLKSIRKEVIQLS